MKRRAAVEGRSKPKKKFKPDSASILSGFTSTTNGNPSESSIERQRKGKKLFITGGSDGQVDENGTKQQKRKKVPLKPKGVKPSGDNGTEHGTTESCIISLPNPFIGNDLGSRGEINSSRYMPALKAADKNGKVSHNSSRQCAFLNFFHRSVVDSLSASHSLEGE